MRIRNDHPDARLVPAAHAEVEPGDAITWPAGTPVPDGFSIVPAAVKPARKKPTQPDPAPDTALEESATTQEQ